MSELYHYDNCTQAPSLGELEVEVEAQISVQLAAPYFSYNPDEDWLKIWFEEALSAEQEDVLDAIVQDAIDHNGSWHRETGCVYLDILFNGSASQKWITKRERIHFKSEFVNVPAVVLSNRSQTVEVAQRDTAFFDYEVRVRNTKNVSRTPVTFDWEAKG